MTSSKEPCLRPLSQLEQMQLNIAARFVAGPLPGKVSLVAVMQCAFASNASIQRQTAAIVDSCLPFQQAIPLHVHPRIARQSKTTDQRGFLKRPRLVGASCARPAWPADSRVPQKSSCSTLERQRVAHRTFRFSLETGPRKLALRTQSSSGSK